MRNLFIASLLSLSAGFAAGAFWLARPTDGTAPSTDVDARIAGLERAIGEERAARQLLEDQLFALIDEVDALDDEPVPRPTSTPADEVAVTTIAEPPLRSRRQTERTLESRAEQLVSGGFSEDRAGYIANREAQLRFEAMQARFEAQQNGEDINFFEAALNADRALRNELGEAEYERYLEANNRPTAVAVNNVLELSPAEQAGLRSGDRIVRYNGARVYNVAELNRLQVDPTVGDNVVVEIERDGVSMQVTMPRGPLGIMAGRRR